MESQVSSKENIVVIRPSFKKFCDNDACQAATFNHLLHSIAYKFKKGFDYWYGTGEQINEGLDHCWGLNKTNQAIKAIVALGIIGQRRNPVKGWDQTRQYFFKQEQAEKLIELCKEHKICLLHIGLPVDLLNLINAFSKNNKCICPKQQMQSLNLTNAFVESNEAIPEDTTKVTSEDTNKGNNASSDAPLFSSFSSNGHLNGHSKDTPREETSQPKKRSTLQSKLASLETFDFEQEATVEAIQALGDCWRGGPLPVVKRADSDYQKALMQGAIPLSQKQRSNGKKGYTLQEIDMTYRFLKRIAPKDKPWLMAEEWWVGKPIDLWVIAKNIDNALASIEKIEAEKSKPSLSEQRLQRAPANFRNRPVSSVGNA